MESSGAPSTAAPSFDGQVGDFDHRAGPPPGVREQVASALVELTAPSPSDLLLELGAGTGAIGGPLAARVGRYLGLDVSRPMLVAFRESARHLSLPEGRALLVQADADRGWPLRGGSVRIFFASRAVHLLDEAHLLAELQRTGRPEGAVLVLGHVRRERESWREALRRALQQRLKEMGLAPRSSARTRERLSAALERAGGGAVETRTAAQWPVHERPAEAIAAWRGKPGLAGLLLPPEQQRDALDWLESWARDHFGDLESIHVSTERYELTTLRLPGGGWARSHEGGS